MPARRYGLRMRRLPPLPPPARRHPGLRRRRRRLDRTGVRRPGLPAHGRRRPGGHAAAVARTERAWRGRRGARVRAEVFVADADGGSARRLTWWGGAAAAAGRRRATCSRSPPPGSRSAGRPGRGTSRWTAAPPRRREHGPLSDLALSADSPGVLLATTRSLESAWWKRYRGGTAAKLWWDADGTGEFVRLLAGIDAQLESPMQVGRPARVPVRPRGLGQPLLRSTGRAATCAGTPTTAGPARPRSTCGTRAPTATGWSTSRRASCGSSTP